MSDRKLGILNPGEELNGAHNDRLLSPSGRFFLVMQDDNNLVLYQMGPGGGVPNHALWASNTNTGPKGTSVARMQGDGNFVVYRQGHAVWASNTNGNGNSFVRMQDDGNVVIYHAIWATGTNQ